MQLLTTILFQVSSSFLDVVAQKFPEQKSSKCCARLCRLSQPGLLNVQSKSRSFGRRQCRAVHPNQLQLEERTSRPCDWTSERGSIRRPAWRHRSKLAQSKSAAGNAAKTNSSTRRRTLSNRPLPAAHPKLSKCFQQGTPLAAWPTLVKLHHWQPRHRARTGRMKLRQLEPQHWTEEHEVRRSSIPPRSAAATSSSSTLSSKQWWPHLL